METHQHFGSCRYCSNLQQISMKSKRWNAISLPETNIAIHSPWKWMVGILSRFLLGPSAYVQGRLLAVSFREGRCNQPLSTLKAHHEAVPNSVWFLGGWADMAAGREVGWWMECGAVRLFLEKCLGCLKINDSMANEMSSKMEFSVKTTGF